MKAQSFKTVSSKLVRVLPIVVFVVIGARQIVLVQSRGLSPWKGGGFGLFSTIDKGQNRELFLMAQDTEGKLCRIHVAFSDEGGEKGLDREFRNRLFTYPDPERLRDLGRRLLRAQFVTVPTRVQLLRAIPADLKPRVRLGTNEPEPSQILKLPGSSVRKTPENERVRIRALRLSMWRLRFDPETARMRWETVGETVELGQWI